MKFVDEFRDPEMARSLMDKIAEIMQTLPYTNRQPLLMMEFCGGHTHAIMRFGLRRLLPSTVRLLSGPGCPVCVTAASDVDRALCLARRGDVILATFGDMVRVPGSKGSLEEAKAQGERLKPLAEAAEAGAARPRGGAIVSTASIAGLLLTTDAAITDIKEKKEKAAAPGAEDYGY